MHLLAGGGNKDWKAAAEGGADTGGKLQPKAVILHAPLAGNDSPDCIAYRLARRYMQRFCPRWSTRYPVQQLSRSVYTQLSEHSHTGLFRWSDAALPDPDGWREQPAETILQRMSECKKQELDFSLYSH